MNLRDLEYLIALDQYGHFGRAARHCHVSQPTLSGQVRKLEEELGVALFERTKGKTVTTAAGQLIIRHAKTILAEAKAIEQTAANWRDPLAGPLHVGLIPTVAPYLLPLLVDPLRKALPDLKLVLHELQTTQILDRLRTAAIELGVLALPLGQADLEEIAVYDEPFVLAVPPGHALGRKRSISPDRLEDLPMLLLEEGHCFRGQALAICQRYHARTEESFRATSLETLRHMVVLGAGCTLVPELTAKAWAREGGHLVTVPLSSPRPSRRVGLLFRSSSARRACFAAIAATIETSTRPQLSGGKKGILPVTIAG